ncbi:unnamed protein product [Cylicocyclus nassatus]|uniref:Uncharacterized protein n=1 Tax=Cylicocyclus nassatus TaxID=53992 RepID=A0AA36DP35_CYLNA|nr:unnamed protein product [Cylicocyclus nassatus]
MIPNIFLLILLPTTCSALKILQVTDFHLDVDYSVKGDNQKMCHGNSSNATLGTFGDYMCDAPVSLAERTLAEAYRVIHEPDLVLWTGDSIPHIDDYDWAYVNKTMELMTSSVFARFPNSKILPVFGNHDYSPANAFDKNSVLYKTCWEQWRKKIGDSEKDRFLLGGYYKFPFLNTTILVLNTNLYYKPNKAYDNFTSKEDPADQFAFMETELLSAFKCRQSASPNCSRTVHIVAHIAPGVFERTPGFSWFRDPYNEKFLDLTVRYADVIGLMIFGHHHTDTFHLVKDASGKTVQFMLMAPAVTPWFSSLDGAGANNPAFRIYDVNTDGLLNDISTYYINLTELNKNDSAKFELEYSFKTAYNITSAIDIAAMEKLLERIKTDDNVFKKYIDYNSVLWDPKMPEAKFRAAQLCSMEFADYPRYDNCMKPYNFSPSNRMFATITLLLLLFTIWT